MICKICRKRVEKETHKLCKKCFVTVGAKIAEKLGGMEAFWELFNKFNAVPKEVIRQYLDEKGMTDEKSYKKMRELLKISEPS